MANQCLAGCIADYECGPLHTPGPAGEQGESFAPWVKVEIIAGQSITVGNESYSADKNTAIVKSFEVGWIDTPTAIIEVVDEAGGQMGALVNAINKCAKAVEITSIVKFQFGWIVTDCNGNKKTVSSYPFELTLLKIEVSYAEGKVKYKLTGNHAGVITDHLREDFLIGTDDKRVPLEEAIREIYSKDPAINVRFCKQDESGKLIDTKFKWKNFQEGGPKEVWQADNQARDAVVRKWIDPFRIDDGTIWGKGIKLIDDNRSVNTKILLVDPSPNPGEGMSNCGGSLGTFIVNGGKCSSVIEFSPTFNWISGVTNFSAGGGTNGPGGTENTFSEDYAVENASKDHGPTAGLQTQTGMTQQSWSAYGPKYAYSETMRSQMAHLKGATVESGISAELRILGDPRPPFCEPGMLSRNVSIVAINPFHIQKSINKGCGDWLAIPGCNQILSNKNWRVEGINHSIKEGSYTTTLKLKLDAPGIDQGKDEPVGKQGSGGPTVKNNCK